MVVDFSLVPEIRIVVVVFSEKILQLEDEHFLSEFLAASRSVCNLKFSISQKAFWAALRLSACSPFATLSGPLQALLQEDGSHPEDNI